MSLLAKIVLIIHQRAFASNCFHHSFAAISFSRFPIVLLCVVFKYTENNFSNDFVRKHIATKLEPLGFGKHSCAIGVAFCPSRDTSSVKNGIQKSDGLNNQDGESPSITLCCILPCPNPRHPTLLLLFCFAFLQFLLPSQVSITRFYYLQEYNSKYINEGCAFSPI